MNIYLDDITGYRFKVFKLQHMIGGIGVSATMHDKTKPLLAYAQLNNLCKLMTRKGLKDYQYRAYETKEHHEYAETWRGRVAIGFFGD